MQVWLLRLGIGGSRRMLACEGARCWTTMVRVEVRCSSSGARMRGIEGTAGGSLLLGDRSHGSTRRLQERCERQSPQAEEAAASSTSRCPGQEAVWVVLVDGLPGPFFVGTTGNPSTGNSNCARHGTAVSFPAPSCLRLAPAVLVSARAIPVAGRRPRQPPEKSCVPLPATCGPRGNHDDGGPSAEQAFPLPA